MNVVSLIRQKVLVRICLPYWWMQIIEILKIICYGFRLQEVAKQNVVSTAEDEPMSCEEKIPAECKTKSASSSQNEKLYTAEGILDPRKRRAEKKRRKANKHENSNEMDTDYDFKVDYRMKDRPSDMIDEGESDGEDETNAEVPVIT